MADLINAQDRIQNEVKALLALLKYFPSLSLPNGREKEKVQGIISSKVSQSQDTLGYDEKWLCYEDYGHLYAVFTIF